MDDHAKHRQFERNFTPGLIGLPVEDHGARYENLQRQPTKKGETLATLFYDLKNGRQVCVSHLDGTVTIDRDTVFPKERMTLAADHPLVKEVWENGEMFHLAVPHGFDDGATHIRSKDTDIYVDDTRVYPKNELK